MFIPNSPSILPTSAIVKLRPPFDFGETHHKEKTCATSCFHQVQHVSTYKMWVDQQQTFGEVICNVTKLFSFSCEHGIFFEDNANLKGFENV